MVLQGTSTQTPEEIIFQDRTNGQLLTRTITYVVNISPALGNTHGHISSNCKKYDTVYTLYLEK